MAPAVQGPSPGARDSGRGSGLIGEVTQVHAAPAASVALCRYCRAKLNAFYYFCTACGTPYKAIEAVVPAASPRPLSEGELVTLKAPGVAPLFWTYFAVVLGAAIFSFVLFRERRPDLQLFLNDVAILVTTAAFALVYWRSLAVQLKRIGFDHAAAFLALALLPVALAVNFGYHSFLTDTLGLRESHFLERLRGLGISEATLIVSFCLFPAVTEEIAFRGLVQHWLQTAIQPWRAVVFASFLFTVLHFSILSFPILFGIGLLLGWAKWKTNSLYPSMVIHFLHNYIVITYW